MKTLKVEVIDKNFCRRRIYGIKHFHICAASIHRALNEAVCDVSNIKRDLFKHLDQVNSLVDETHRSNQKEGLGVQQF